MGSKVPLEPACRGWSLKASLMAVTHHSPAAPLAAHTSVPKAPDTKRRSILNAVVYLLSLHRRVQLGTTRSCTQERYVQ